MHLGELAAAKAETDDGDRITFDWHDERIRCRAKLPAMAGLELASMGEDALASGTAEDLMTVGAAFYRFLRSVIDPADWRRFKEACISHGDDAEDLLPVVQRLVEATTGRPTRPRSDSGPLPQRGTGGSTERSASVA